MGMMFSEVTLKEFQDDLSQWFTEYGAEAMWNWLLEFEEDVGRPIEYHPKSIVLDCREYGSLSHAQSEYEEDLTVQFERADDFLYYLKIERIEIVKVDYKDRVILMQPTFHPDF